MSSVPNLAEFQSRQASILEAPQSRRIKKILLLDGYSSRTLACVRSWGRRGIDFVVGGESKLDMSLHSRYTREKCVYASPKSSVSQFISDVNAHCRHFGADHIFPTSEAAIMACSERASELIGVPIIPERRAIDTMFSKVNTAEIAQAVGIRVPATVQLTPSNPRLPDHYPWKFPVVVKSESSETMLDGKAVSSRKTFYASNLRELECECKARLTVGQSVMLQQFIDGYGVGISGLFSNGEAVALIGHRRVRESNPLGGPSAVAETIEMDPGLLCETKRLLRKIGHTGPAMVEYKVDRRDGQAYLMEINGRFWGSILLASAAGLDLPYIYWKMLNGQTIREDETQYQVGVRGRNLVGDTKCLLMCLKGKPNGWPGEMESRLSSIRGYLMSFFDQGTTELLLADNDPMPFFARFIQPHS